MQTKHQIKARDTHVGTWSWGAGTSLTVAIIKQASEEDMTGTCGIYLTSPPTQCTWQTKQHTSQVSAAPCPQLQWPKMFLPLPGHLPETQSPRRNILVLRERRRGKLSWHRCRLILGTPSGVDVIFTLWKGNWASDRLSNRPRSLNSYPVESATCPGCSLTQSSTHHPLL